MLRSVPTPRSTVAAVLVAVQAGFGALGGLLLLALAGERRRSFVSRLFHRHAHGRPVGAAILLLVLAVVLVLLAVALYRRRPWSRAVVYLVEAVVGAGGLLGFHPLRSLAGLALAVAVLVAVATDPPLPEPPA
jgi:hypothetical protein